MSRSDGKHRSSSSKRRKAPVPSSSSLWLDAAIVVLLVTAQAVASWWFGGVSLLSQICCAGLIVLALTIAWCRAWFSQSQGFRLPWVSLALLIATLWGVFQTVPLPASLSQTLASQQAKVRLEAGTLTDVAEDANATSSTISLHPHATRMDLGLLALCGAVFTAATIAFHRSLTAALLLLLVSLNGMAIAFFGLIQQMNWQGKIYWLYESPGHSPFGPFINGNNAGGYLNLCLGAAIGLAAYVFSLKKDKAFYNKQEEFQGWLGKLSFRLRWEVANVTAPKLFCMVFVVFIAVGVACSLSRGAILALAFAAILTLAASILSRKSVAGLWLGVFLLLAGVAVSSFVGMTDAVKDELATISEEVEENERSPRVQLWRSLKPTAKNYAVTGSGLGTFRHVYRQYVKAPDNRWFYHAENQYIEAFLDAGVLGLSLMVLAIFGVCFSALLLLRRGQSRRHYALGLATIFALSSQAFHAGFDFGLYLPSNAWLLALLSGACCGEALGLQGKTNLKNYRIRMPKSVALVTWIGCFLITCIACVYLYRGAQLEVAMRAAPKDLDDASLTLAKVDAAIAQLKPWAIATDSSDGLKKLADLQMARYRVQRLAEAMDQLEDATDEQRDRLWLLTTPLDLHRQSYVVFQAQGQDGVARWQQSITPIDDIRAAHQSLLRSRNSNPLNTDTHLALAQTCLVEEPIPADAIHVERATKFAPQRASVFFLAGLLDLQGDRIEECANRWQNAIRLSPRQYRQEIVDVGLERMSMEDFAEKVMPADPVLLLQAEAEIPANIPRSKEKKAALLARAEALLVGRSLIPEEEHTLGLLYKRQEKWMLALAAFDAALVGRNAYQKEWLLDRAKVCVELYRRDHEDVESYDRALKDLATIDSLKPSWGPARKLRQNLKKLKSE